MSSFNKYGYQDDSNTNGAIQPKLGYRFKVELVGFGNNTSSADLTNNVISVTPADFSQEEVMIDTYVSRYYVIGKHTIGDVSLELRNDANSNVARIIQQQLDRQFHAERQAHAANAGDVKFEMRILYLDGTNSGSGAEILEGYLITGCWIKQNTASQLQTTSSDPSTFSLTIRPDNVFHIVKNVGNQSEQVNIGNASTTTLTVSDGAGINGSSAT